MPLTPDELLSKKFPVVYGRGYDRSEVDQFLGLVAEDYAAAIQKIAVAAEGGIPTEDDIGSEVAEVLRTARDTAMRIKNKAQAEADSMMAHAEADVREQREAAAAEVRAQLEKAEKERDDLLEQAEARARRTIESFDQQKSEFVALVQERYRELLEYEKELRSRIDGLEKLVADMRVLLEPIEQIDLTDEVALIVEALEAAESLFAERSGVDDVDLQRRQRTMPGRDENT
jgi:DivIVA domain-containing protein